jgi:hypothetical protein
MDLRASLELGQTSDHKGERATLRKVGARFSSNRATFFTEPRSSRADLSGRLGETRTIDETWQIREVTNLSGRALVMT